MIIAGDGSVVTHSDIDEVGKNYFTESGTLGSEMPEVDGPMVLERLRQVPQTQNIPVVFLTGVGTKEHVARVMGLKPNGYILKTTTRENLLEYIKSKLD
ncbi:MAG: response regulator [Lachnospiraceae bacterium]|nr:response regulator [Lachnospiraceae bacterium]